MTLFLLHTILLLMPLHAASREAGQDEKVYTVSEVSVKPQPIIGLADFQKKWSRTVKYPDHAVRQKIQGMVYIEFIVDTDGSIREAAIRSGIGHGCDEAALKAFSELSKDGWKPGIKKDAPVKVKMVLPFYFKIIEG
jgi:periplasmic protein TonB